MKTPVSRRFLSSVLSKMIRKRTTKKECHKKHETKKLELKDLCSLESYPEEQ